MIVCGVRLVAVSHPWMWVRAPLEFAHPEWQDKFGVARWSVGQVLTGWVDLWDEVLFYFLARTWEHLELSQQWVRGWSQCWEMTVRVSGFDIGWRVGVRCQWLTVGYHKWWTVNP